MNKRVILFVSAILFVLSFSDVAASSEVSTTIGTFIETETNNEPWAGANQAVVPGLNFGLAGKETPIYGWIHFENREQAGFSDNGYIVHELRSNFRFGSNLKLGSTSFNPE